jgi:hypothetical protein
VDGIGEWKARGERGEQNSGGKQLAKVRVGPPKCRGWLDAIGRASGAQGRTRGLSLTTKIHRKNNQRAYSFAFGDESEDCPNNAATTMIFVSTPPPPPLPPEHTPYSHR